ncbi:MAG: hypothetical protein Q7T89_01705, partial [Anaerolineales bacterium]|nr:hypothetical protein [Anaerolineales bacterium]
RAIRSTFEWFCKSSKKFPALLDAVPMRMASRNGRPQQAYLLTEFGGKVLRLLEPPIIARVNKPKDEKDLHHRFAQLNVLTRALQNGWQAEVEKVIPYARGKEVRCDVFITQPDGTNIYVEVEQELTRNNIERAREKFRNWQAYALSKGIVPDMIFVFNLPDAKLTHTLNSWQEALGCVSEAHDFALDVRYILAGALEGRSFDTALQSYSVWMEPIVQIDEGSGAASEALGQTAAPEVWLPEANELLPEFERRVDTYSDAGHPADRIKAFFELMLYIHDASYGRDSDVYKYNELPAKSLWLLRRYLNLPQNQVMYEELKQAMVWLKSRGSMGLIIMRDTLCGILWDTFLKQHKLAMGGRLRVTLDVPDYVNHNSTFEVKVLFWDTTEDMKRDEYGKALAWVMTAFLWYPKYLETGTQPWKKKGKGKG